MKVNSNKCHLITNKQSCINLKIENADIENSTCEKLPGVKMDNKLNFNEHLDGITKTANGKVSSLSRIFSVMGLTKRHVLMNSVLKFNYCLPIWMCHQGIVSSKMNKLHERYLWIVYHGQKSSFKELLQTDKSMLIHINPTVRQLHLFYQKKFYKKMSFKNCKTLKAGSRLG